MSDHDAVRPIGRFAPSPSGSLHLGSMMAAVASYLNVKSVGGKWLLRLDDLDQLRVVRGSVDHIFNVLEQLKFEWDQVIFQSQRTDYYFSALEKLERQGLIYACACSRSQINQRMGRSGGYDNQCRSLPISEHFSGQASLRLYMPEQTQGYEDAIQASYKVALSSFGDIIVQRADGIWSYHLACAVDDADFGITEVVRGMDLLESMPPQRYIQHCLGKDSPLYAHYPILLSPHGVKFSKASGAPSVDLSHPSKMLHTVLDLLGQEPPNDLIGIGLDELWQWAMTHWQLSKIPKVSSVCLNHLAS